MMITDICIYHWYTWYDSLISLRLCHCACACARCDGPHIPYTIYQQVLNYKIFPTKQHGTVHYYLWKDCAAPRVDMMEKAFKYCDIATESPLQNTDTTKLFEGLGAASSTSQFCDCTCSCADTCDVNNDKCALKPPYYLMGEC